MFWMSECDKLNYLSNLRLIHQCMLENIIGRPQISTPNLLPATNVERSKCLKRKIVNIDGMHGARSLWPHY